MTSLLRRRRPPNMYTNTPFLGVMGCRCIPSETYKTADTEYNGPNTARMSFPIAGRLVMEIKNIPGTPHASLPKPRDGFSLYACGSKTFGA